MKESLLIISFAFYFYLLSYLALKFETFLNPEAQHGTKKKKLEKNALRFYLIVMSNVSQEKSEEHLMAVESLGGKKVYSSTTSVFLYF